MMEAALPRTMLTTGAKSSEGMLERRGTQVSSMLLAQRRALARWWDWDGVAEGRAARESDRHSVVRTETSDAAASGDGAEEDDEEEEEELFDEKENWSHESSLLKSLRVSMACSSCMDQTGEGEESPSDSSEEEHEMPLVSSCWGG